MTYASPAWSPERHRLAFARYTERRRGVDSSIMVAARDGSAARAVVTERLDRRLTGLGEPAWLPDGGTLGYTRTRLDRRSYFRPSVFTVAAVGGTPRRLLADAQSATWSPDGSKIAYSSVRDKVEGSCGSDECFYAGELYVESVAGDGPPRQLTRNRGGDASPEWSADGSRILFSSDRNYPGAGNDEIYSIRSDGACLTWLTNGSPDSADPVWRPGAGERFEPARCGAAGRGALVEISTAGAGGSFWLGAKRHRGLLLSDVERGPAGAPGVDGRLTQVDYGDCGRFRARDCPSPVLIFNLSVCNPLLQPAVRLEARGTRLRRARGTVVADRGPAEGFELYSGSTFARVTAGGRRAPGRYRAILRDLVRIGTGDRRGRELPIARLPAYQARALREALATRPRYRTDRSAARVLSVSPALLRARLRLGRALRASGGILAARCP